MGTSSSTPPAWPAGPRAFDLSGLHPTSFAGSDEMVLGLIQVELQVPPAAAAGPVAGRFRPDPARAHGLTAADDGVRLLAGEYGRGPAADRRCAGRGQNLSTPTTSNWRNSARRPRLHRCASASHATAPSSGCNDTHSWTIIVRGLPRRRHRRRHGSPPRRLTDPSTMWEKPSSPVWTIMTRSAVAEGVHQGRGRGPLPPGGGGHHRRPQHGCSTCPLSGSGRRPVPPRR